MKSITILGLLCALAGLVALRFHAMDLAWTLGMLGAIAALLRLALHELSQAMRWIPGVNQPGQRCREDES